MDSRAGRRCRSCCSAPCSLLSLAARLALLGEPCHAPCRSATDHMLIFDEAYYVNAARVIAGIKPPAGRPLRRRAARRRSQRRASRSCAKLIIAGAIELFGDGPFAWRIGSLMLRHAGDPRDVRAGARRRRRPLARRWAPRR